MIPQGLSAQEVEARVSQGAVNGNTEVKTKSVRQIVLEHTLTLFNFLNLALAFLLIWVGSFKNMMFMGVVLCNAAIGIFQEIRAKKAIDRLSIVVESRIEAVRDGLLTQIRPEDIVLDDVLHLKRGNQVPVDCVMLQGHLSANESLVTGESDLIGKQAGDELISGSFIAEGDGFVRVLRVGADTFAARITKDAKVIKNAESEIMTTLKHIITIISFVIVPLGILLYLNQMELPGATFTDAVVSTVAALVTMIPEGLMLLTSTVLAVGVIRLSRKNVLVQQIYCIETLARVDVLCLDKTGTITSGRMQAADLIPMSGISREEADRAFQCMASVSRDEGATIDAIRECFGVDKTIAARRVVAFSSEKKWSGASFDGVTYVMGAGEMMFGDDFQAIEESIRSRIGTMRVIMLAKTENGFNAAGDLPAGLIPMAALLIRDEIRPEAQETIRYFIEQGVELKVISGDSAETVSHIAAKAGVPNAAKAVDARTLTDEALIEAAARENAVFGRVTPAQKQQLIRALQRQGHTVAMTGDGVNDVLAMKASDCSIAMAAGSDAARNTAQLVLTTNDFSSMPKVVAEGRRSINNIQRSSSLFLTKTIFSILNSILFSFASLRYPFEPIQMTYISSLTIGIPSFILAMQPNRERVSGNFFLNISSRALSGGLTMFIGLLLTYLLGHLFHLSFEEISTISVIATASTLVSLIFKISKPFDFVRTCLFVFVLASLAVVGYVLRDLLGFVYTGWVNIMVAAIVVVLDGIIFALLYQELEKLRLYLSDRFPEEYLKERRRQRLEKRARRREARKEKAA